jgi:hypothetical protein
MVLRLNWPSDALEQRLRLRQTYFTMNYPKSYIHSFQDAFGGEVYIDNVLCYKNRVQLANPFPLKPLPAGHLEIYEIELEDSVDFQPPQ